MNASNPHRQELVVVTGASTGIGAATARELALRGFHVLAGVRRDVDAESLRTDGSSRTSSTSPLNRMWPPSPTASLATRCAGLSAR